MSHRPSLSGISELYPVPSGEPALAEAVELIPSRLFFAPLKPRKLDYILALSARSPLGFAACCVDHELVYAAYEQDFGPLNLACLLRFCAGLDLLLQHPGSQLRPVYFCCSAEPKTKANAAFLIGAFLVLRFHLSVEHVFELLSGAGRFAPFRDASRGGFDYFITVQHCLQGIARASGLGWLESEEHRLREYEKLDAADLSWMIPGKILAFSTPSRDSQSPGTAAPEDYIPYFKKAGIAAVVRLNKRVYERRRFTAQGFAFFDLHFTDGRPPPEHVRTKFLSITEGTKGPVAVHCKAGLGRTGVLVGTYLMKHYRFSANEAIAYMRIIRPGSVIGQQQVYLARMEGQLWSEGETYNMAHREKLVTPVLSLSEESRLSFTETDDESSVLEVDPGQTVTPEPQPKLGAAHVVRSETLLTCTLGRRIKVDSEDAEAAAIGGIEARKGAQRQRSKSQLHELDPLPGANRSRLTSKGWFRALSAPHTHSKSKARARSRLDDDARAGRDNSDSLGDVARQETNGVAARGNRGSRARSECASDTEAMELRTASSWKGKERRQKSNNLLRHPSVSKTEQRRSGGGVQQVEGSNTTRRLVTKKGSTAERRCKENGEKQTSHAAREFPVPRSKSLGGATSSCVRSWDAASGGGSANSQCSTWHEKKYSLDEMSVHAAGISQAQSNQATLSDQVMAPSSSAKEERKISFPLILTSLKESANGGADFGPGTPDRNDVKSQPVSSGADSPDSSPAEARLNGASEERKVTASEVMKVPADQEHGPAGPRNIRRLEKAKPALDRVTQPSSRFQAYRLLSEPMKGNSSTKRPHRTEPHPLQRFWESFGSTDQRQHKGSH